MQPRSVKQANRKSNFNVDSFMVSILNQIGKHVPSMTQHAMILTMPVPDKHAIPQIYTRLSIGSIRGPQICMHGV